MFDFIRGRFSHQFRSFRRQWCGQQALPFTDVLSPDRVETLLAEEDIEFRQGIFTPSVTLWTFLGQVFNPDHSCREAVARLIAFLVGQGRRPCAASTGAYCTARQRLPEHLLARLVWETGDQLHAAVSAESLCLAGRAVYVVDGTTVSMPDTPANQKAYPQARTQRPGVGFPIARLVALFSLASGAVLDMAVGPYRGKGTGERSLLRPLLGRLQPNTVLLGDCGFCSYWIFALLANRDTYGVFCLHQRRPVDFRQGKRLGSDDRLVVWKRPPCPDWMTMAEYDDLLDELVIREVRVRVRQRGFRTRELVVATTLLDPKEASVNEVAHLYRARWHAELHLRSLKSVLDMDVLRCKTPEMVRKELWAHLLVYNLVRELMAQAALREGVEPHRSKARYHLKRISNLPLGILDPTEYAQFAIELSIGDRVVLYTDGIIEAEDAGGAQLGTAGLLDLLQHCSADRTSRPGEQVLATLARRQGQRPAKDDSTLMLLEKVEGGRPSLSMAATLRTLGKMLRLSRV